MAAYSDIVNSLCAAGLDDVPVDVFKTYLLGAIIDASYHDGHTVPTSTGRIRADTDLRNSHFAEQVKMILAPAKNPNECLILLQAEKIKCPD